MRIPLYRGGEQPKSGAKIQTPLGDTRPTRVNMGKIDAQTIANFSSEPTADPRPFVRQAGAVGSYGDAIKEAGGVLEKLALVKAETVNRLNRAEAEAKMNGEYEAFEKWKQDTNAHPKNWGEEWKRISESLDEKIVDPSYSPALQDDLKESLIRFKSRSNIIVETAATKRLFEMENEHLGAIQIKEQDAGNEAGALDALNQRYQYGHIGEDDFEEGKIQIRERVKAKKEENAFTSVDGFISLSPKDADFIATGKDEEIATVIPEWNTLDARAKTIAKNRAVSERNRMQSEKLESIYVAASRGEYLPKAQIEGMVQVKELDAISGERYLDMTRNENPNSDDMGAVMALAERIDKYDPKEDTNGSKGLEIQREMGNYSDLRIGWLRNRYNQRMDEKSGKIPAHPYAGIARQGIYEAYYADQFGERKKTVIKKVKKLDDNGNEIKDEFVSRRVQVVDWEATQEARKERAKALDMLDMWLRDPVNAKASKLDVEKFVGDLVPKTVGMGNVNASLLEFDDVAMPEDEMGKIIDGPELFRMDEDLPNLDDPQ